MTTGNGRTLLKWLVGVLAAAIITGVTSWSSYMMGYDARLDERIIRLAQRTTAAEVRTAAVESSFTVLQTQLNTIHMELSNIRTDLREQWKGRR